MPPWTLESRDKILIEELLMAQAARSSGVAAPDATVAAEKCELPQEATRCC